MVIAGQVHNGVVVLDGDAALPEGAVVAVTYPAPEITTVDGREPAGEGRVQVPLVPTGKPGSVQLTNQRILEILDEEDARSAGSSKYETHGSL